MIEIDNKLVSKGACCVQGDAGAPLEDEERKILETEYENFKEMLSPEGRKAIEKEGKWTEDGDGDWVTPLNKGKECAYTVFENGIANCGIELAWKQGLTKFRKPVSCHLYPIRVTKLGSHFALNYHVWNVCHPATILGANSGTPVFKFLKEPIIRAYGENFYTELEHVDNELNKRKEL